MDYKQIVWLSSYPKSGNTWVRCFLEAYILQEVDLNNIMTSVGDDTAARCLPGDGTEPHKLPVQVQVLLRGMGLVRLVHQYQRDDLFEKVPLFVKTHNAHMLCNGVELIPEALTKAVIHIVRDPRDVIVSFAKHTGNDMDKTIEIFTDRLRVLADKRVPKMFDFISSWNQQVSSYANADSHNVMIVKYEDLKRDPEAEFERIIKHAGMPFDKERMKQAIEAVEISKLQEKEKKEGFMESSPFAKNEFFGPGKVGNWQDKLTENQLFRIEKECRSMMKRFGYEAVRSVA